MLAGIELKLSRRRPGGVSYPEHQKHSGLSNNNLLLLFRMVGDLLVAILGHDEAVTHLDAERFGDGDRTIDCQHHARLDNGLVADHQLQLFQEAIADRPATTEWIIETGLAQTRPKAFAFVQRTMFFPT